MNQQVLPRFGDMPLRDIANSDVRSWVVELMQSGLSAATTRKAVFALRQALEAAIADQRLVHNASAAVPLPSERAKPARYLSQTEVERLVAELPPRDRALVLVGACAGLCWGEAAGLRRQDIDPLRSRIRVVGTALELRGRITLDNEPKTARPKRTILVARAVMRRIGQHLDNYVETPSEVSCSTPRPAARRSGPGARTPFNPLSAAQVLPGITFHGVRHSFVAIMVAAGCNVREVSEWAGHNSVAFTLTRYGGLFEDGTHAAIDRLDALLGPM